MIINNTQANIFKVNGGLADIFANRPAASGSFYVFYSIDTQEIFYDSGIWVLIGTGNLPTPTNIYNSDGTLTGNRTLNGGNFDLLFINFGVWQILSTNGVITSAGTIDFTINTSGLVTRKSTVVSGLNLNLNSKKYEFGQINGGNTTYLTIDDQNNTIKTSNQGNDIGLKLDFANDVYQIGNSQANFVINSSVPYFQTYMFGGGIFDGLGITATSAILGYNNIGTGTKFVILPSGSAIYTVDNNLGTGLRLDFSANDYTFGQFGGSNKTYLKIDDSINLLFTSNQNTNNGLRFEFSNKIYLLGHYNGGNTTYLTINDQNNLIKTSNQGNDIGLKLDFANSEYELGANAALFTSVAGSTCYIGDYLGNQDSTYLYIYGQGLIKTSNQNNDIGLKLDFANSIYQLGQLTGSNTTYLTIDDAAAYPIQIDGTNLLSGTSGSNSGQHLKIKLNGVDYKIKLENP